MKGPAVAMDKKGQELVLRHMAYARNLAKKFFRERQHVGTDFEDFQSAAYYGLCDAARRFQPQRGCAFVTFAYLRILGAMYDLLRHEGVLTREQYHLCYDEEERLRNNRRLGHKGGKNSRTPRYAIAQSAEDLVRLSSVIEECGIELHWSAAGQVVELSYARAADPETIISDRLARTRLHRQIDALPERERQLIELRYFSECSFDEIRQAMDGPSRSWMSRLHRQAVDIVREKMKGERYEPLLEAA